MVARLKRSVLRSAPAGASAEIGGLLLGQAVHEADGSAVLDISDFMILPSAPGAGSEYRLPVEEVRRLGEGSNLGRGTRTIGYFRTQDDSDFTLRPHEAALTDEVLKDPCVVILLHAVGGDRVLAALVHSGGESLRRTPAKLFQFDEAALGAVQPITIRPSTAAATGMLKRADSRGINTQLLRAGAVALAALFAGALAAYWWSGRFGPSKSDSVRGGSSRVRAEIPAIQTIAPGPPSSGLEISVNRANGGVMIGWSSARALHAASGQLMITDGNAPSEIVPLGSHELQQGKVFYRSRSERLRFRVELADSMGRRYSDSVLVLGGPQGAASSQGVAQRAVTPVATRSQPPESESPPPEASQPAPARRFQPPPEQPSQPVERVISLDAPSPLRVGAPVSLNIGQTAVAPPPSLAPLGTPRPSRSPVGSPPVESGATPGSEPHVSGANASSGTRQYVAPVALSQVTPRLDSVLRSVLVNDVEIEVKLQIDASGRVVQAQPVHTEAGLHEHIERAAIEAAMRWRFKPASIDGTPVPSVTVVKFVFRR